GFDALPSSGCPAGDIGKPSLRPVGTLGKPYPSGVLVKMPPVGCYALRDLGRYGKILTEQREVRMGGSRNDELYLTFLLKAAKGPEEVLSVGIGEVSQAGFVKCNPTGGQAGVPRETLAIEGPDVDDRRPYLLANVFFEFACEKRGCQHLTQYWGDADGETGRSSLTRQFFKR